MTGTWNIPAGPIDDAPPATPKWDKDSPALPLTLAATVPVTVDDAYLWAAQHLGDAAKTCARRAMQATDDSDRNDAVGLMTGIVGTAAKMLAAARTDNDGGAALDSLAQAMLRTVLPLAKGGEVRDIVLACAYLDMARNARMAAANPSLQRNRVPVAPPF